MNVHTLAREEAHVLQLVREQVGTMEQKYSTLAQLGVFASSVTIHQAYVHLAHAEQQLEAFKRAMFLQWYAWVEPACFTGIASVDAASEQMLFKVFAEYLQHQMLDTELVTMLYWYYEVADYYFQAAVLRSHVYFSMRNVSLHGPVDEGINKTDLLLRGQMGRYWASIVQQKRATV